MRYELTISNLGFAFFLPFATVFGSQLVSGCNHQFPHKDEN